MRFASLRAASCALLLVLSTLGLPRASAADVSDHIAAEGGLGVGAALITLVYAPLKLMYATGGLVLGGTGFLWTMGNREVAGAMMRSSLGGDYVVTPSHLIGRSKFHFRGATRESDAS